MTEVEFRVRDRRSLQGCCCGPIRSVPGMQGYLKNCGAEEAMSHYAPLIESQSPSHSP